MKFRMEKEELNGILAIAAKAVATRSLNDLLKGGSFVSIERSG